MPTQSVDRAIAILKQFSAEEPELGVSELSRRLGLTKTTVHRLLASLVQGGLAEQDPATRRYRLGLGLVELYNLAVSRIGQPDVVLPYLRHLADAVGESTYLALCKADIVLPVLHVPGPATVRPPRWVATGPLHSTAVGRVFLAHMLPEEVKGYLDRTSRAGTVDPSTDLKYLQTELAQIREQGFGSSFEEFQTGRNAVAAPVVRGDGTLVAAMSVVGPAYRFTRQKALDSTDSLKAVAAEVSRELDKAV
jgi:IclR family acetate operon transcriptional repressor